MSLNKTSITSLAVIFLSLIASLSGFSAQTAYAVDEATIIQAKILVAFPHNPIMVMVAKCESGLKQFNDDGTVVMSKTHDVGLYQINLKAHAKEAEAFGNVDLTNLDDNIMFAKYIFNKEGMDAWNSSKFCWNKEG